MHYLFRSTCFDNNVKNPVIYSKVKKKNRIFAYDFENICLDATINSIGDNHHAYFMSHVRRW